MSNAIVRMNVVGPNNRPDRSATYGFHAPECREHWAVGGCLVEFDSVADIIGYLFDSDAEPGSETFDSLRKQLHFHPCVVRLIVDAGWDL